MPTDDATVLNLQSHIRDLEQEILDTKRMVNRLLGRKGLPPAYAEASLAAEVGNVFAIRSDQFYGQALSTAIRGYLQMRRTANIGPATVNEIYEALCRGGFAFETENEENRKRNLRISLTKNSALFHRLPNGTHFGLPDWYESISKAEAVQSSKVPKTKKKLKSKAKKRSQASEVPVDVKKEEPAQSASPEKQPANGKTTIVGAVREAIQAMSGEFTKQDVVDWMSKHHPDLKPEQRKTSIFSMMASLKGDLKLTTVKVGKGTEPHKFRRAEAKSDVN